MAFTDAQIRQLRAKLDAEHVKSRKANGATLHYIEGWHAIAEANRIFGFDGWDRKTIAASCVWSGRKGEHYLTAYTAKVRVRVRAGDTTIVREGSGSCEADGLTPGEAHELALKAAETDATKRALATFGNPFGLALYDREQNGVRRSEKSKRRDPYAQGPWLLRLRKGDAGASFDKPEAFAEALKKAMSDVSDIALLFDLWEQNVETVRALHREFNHRDGANTGLAHALVAHLKSCAIALAASAKAKGAREADGIESETIATLAQSKIDKSVLAISEPKRHRSKEHLRLVASQPCLICGRSPSHAHHIRHAQSRGLGLKVSDEFTVPLCAIHHHQNHATGDERRWWQDHAIDPLPVAQELWRKSHPNQPQEVLKPAEDTASSG
jgi:DNA recombination protein Rad52